MKTRSGAAASDPLMTLLMLSKRYQRCSSETPLQAAYALYRRYSAQRMLKLLDVAVTATSLSYVLVEDRADPLALEAIRRAHPQLDLVDHLKHYDSDQLNGIINSSKGKYFELLVMEKLNAGEDVGGIRLPRGYTASLAADLTQPGWDLQILDPDGFPDDFLQLKATERLGYIKDALDRYPDIKILASSDIPPVDGVIFSADIANDELERAVHHALNEVAETPLDRFFDVFSPIVPLLVVAFTEGYRVWIGGESLRLAAERAQERSARIVWASACGALVYAIGGGWLAVPASFGAGLLFSRCKNLADMSVALESEMRFLRVLHTDHASRCVFAGS